MQCSRQSISCRSRIAQWANDFILSSKTVLQASRLEPGYGMPAYANKDGNVVCFFQSSQKFKTRYSTLGFSDKAKLDEGDMWPSAYALMKLTPAVEAKIGALVKKAMS